MTAPLFLVSGQSLVAHAQVLVDGAEGRHAVTVKRLRVGEGVLLADGDGHGAAGVVTAADASGLLVRLEQILPDQVPQPELVAVQALAKADRDELAIEAMTEVGVAEVVPWQSDRCVVRWAAGPRGERQHGKWVATVREAAKQSRRFWMPRVQPLVTTSSLVKNLDADTLVLVLHEEATQPLAGLGDALRQASRIMVVIGPEGGITPGELDALTEAGAHVVSVGPHVLRTSTAGVVALAQIAAVIAR
jgi:16S rRNA (uracil1498-N3)-methyltransferase